MKILERDAAFAHFDNLWEGMRDDFFKLEVRQDYTGEDGNPSLEAWQAGAHHCALGQLALLDDFESFYQARRAKKDAGISLRRVRIVVEPYTDYTNWELLCFRVWNQPSGEEILIVNQTDIEDLYTPPGDIMIIDNRHVVVAGYDEANRVSTETFYDSEKGDDITDFLRLTTEFLARATPFGRQHLEKIGRK